MDDNFLDREEDYQTRMARAQARVAFLRDLKHGVPQDIDEDESERLVLNCEGSPSCGLPVVRWNGDFLSCRFHIDHCACGREMDQTEVSWECSACWRDPNVQAEPQYIKEVA